MVDDQVQIFISYARDDNSVSPELTRAKGFVSTLVDHLDYVFKRQGHPKPKIWWDQRQIDKADRFDPKLQAAIEKSSLLLVIMSRNWLSRPWCRKELELFAQRADAHEHIVLVRWNHVAQSEHPEQLQNIQGYDFFSLDEWREPGNERFFFDRGEIQDDLFLKHVDELGSILWRRARNLQRKTTASTAAAEPPPVSATAPGRTIYLAKPAPDMAKAYDRVANDLVRQGYTVVPPLDQKIPADESSLALAFIDNALASAEASIHLLGEKPGYAPDELDHIVRLQLARAAERAKSPGAVGASIRPFSRIIWAPKIIEEGSDSSVVADFRDPVAVLNKFDSYRSGDQVVGDVSNAFLVYLKRELDLRDPSGTVVNPPVEKPDSRIYVWHRKDDREFARKVHKWLRQQKADAVLPGNDDDADKDKLHRKNLAECDAVFLCWAQATDVWAKMSASDLRSWRDMGRKNKFSVRGLVLGPPPGESKSEDDMPSDYEIDAIVDLSKDDQLMLDRLQPLLDRSRSVLAL
jgi:TIR domain